MVNDCYCNPNKDEIFLSNIGEYGDLSEDEIDKLFDYVNWHNNFGIHSSLNYLTPIEYKKVSL